jgi:hypothetical protein
MALRLPLTFIISLLILISCNVLKSSEEKFWIWFSENADEISLIESVGEGGIVDDLSKELKRVNSNLTFEIGGGLGEEREFIISADGLSEAVPFVTKLVSDAPVLDGWKFIAFRPRLGTDFTLQYEDIELSPEDFWFTAWQDDDRIGLVVYLPKIESEQKNTIISASFVMLDTALGEYDVITKIGFIEYKQLPSNPKEHGLLPLSLLAQTVDDHFEEQ